MALRTASEMRLRSAAETDAGNFLSGRAKGVSSGFCAAMALRLGEDFFHEVLRRRAVVVEAGLHVGHGLGEGEGDFAEAGDVVVVVVGGVEGGVLGELGQVELEAVVLVDGHLPLFELGGFLVFDEGAQHAVRRRAAPDARGRWCRWRRGGR